MRPSSHCCTDLGCALARPLGSEWEMSISTAAPCAFVRRNSARAGLFRWGASWQRVPAVTSRNATARGTTREHHYFRLPNAAASPKEPLARHFTCSSRNSACVYRRACLCPEHMTVGTLLRWYREGIDPNCRLIHLSTFLGHVDPKSTAVYLTISDELLWEAGR